MIVESPLCKDPVDFIQSSALFQEEKIRECYTLREYTCVC